MGFRALGLYGIEHKFPPAMEGRCADESMVAPYGFKPSANETAAKSAHHKKFHHVATRIMVFSHHLG